MMYLLRGLEPSRAFTVNVVRFQLGKLKFWRLKNIVHIVKVLKQTLLVQMKTRNLQPTKSKCDNIYRKRSRKITFAKIIHNDTTKSSESGPSEGNPANLVCKTASKRRAKNFKRFKDFYLKAKAIM